MAIALIALVTCDLGNAFWTNGGDGNWAGRWLASTHGHGSGGTRGRIVILYHVIAMAVIAIETYMVTAW